MNGEDRRHQRTGPQAPRHPPQDHQQQDCRGGVQDHVDQVVGRRVRAEHVPDQDMRQSRQRGKALEVALGKHGPNAPQAELAGYQPVFIDAPVVVIVHKAEAGGLRKYQSRGQQQQSADGRHADAVRGPPAAARQAGTLVPAATRGARSIVRSPDLFSARTAVRVSRPAVGMSSAHGWLPNRSRRSAHAAFRLSFYCILSFRVC